MFLWKGLKKHAVTMFEVGKLPDEQLDSFLDELDNVLYCPFNLQIYTTYNFLSIDLFSNLNFQN